MVRRILILFLTLSFGYVQGVDVVKLNQDIQGTSVTTRSGRTISAYRGIPYAEPPIGQLRFASPVPWGGGDGPINGDKYGVQCPQMSDDGTPVGDEDCLYLNVYTPKIDQESPYPVMVYFHGGNYVRGCSSDAGPEYLLDKDIVLVTVNYRLGVLGYLATNDEVAPGNFGLKDQALALQWVRENILAFGGRPNQVTIFGQDAGGASTVILGVAEKTQGLFDQFISQSGTAIAWWLFADEFHDHYSQHAKDLGDLVKCPTGDSVALVECLRTVDPSTLVDSESIFKSDLPWKPRTWAPTTEPKDVPEAFLTSSPGELSLFKEDWIKDCPALIGTVSDEGLIFGAELYVNDTLYDSITKDLPAFLIPLTDYVAGDGHPKETAKKVQSFYFDSVDMNDKKTVTRALTDTITDSSWTLPTGIHVWMMGEVMSQFYVYKFNYRGSYSTTSDMIGSNDDLGVSHGDDLQYIFPQNNTQLSDSDEKMIDIMVDFWTSFASTGAPTSQQISDPNMWAPFMPEEKALVIGKGSDPLDMSFEEPLEDKRFLFWNQITIGELLEALAAGA